MESCLYEISIMHDRHHPKRYRFVHQVFMFYIDLDELPHLGKYSWLLGYNQAKAYNFRDDDHVNLGATSVKDNIYTYLKKKGIGDQVARVKLLTNVRSFGYIFNPVSFYYCFDASNKPLCVVVEIGNTFGELKYFFLGPDKRREEHFTDAQGKYYYISPFTDLDDELNYSLRIPDAHLQINIDVARKGAAYLYTSMKGKQRALTTGNLLLYTCIYPLVTLKVIFLIHWHAAILHFVKKIKHHPKEENPDLQREVFREWQQR